ncbi:AAA-like domain-containing protein [Pseudomonas sp. B6001]|uniref:AAA-like domain-containing protein n=1 Tax=Pseudomonas sp. B6001 TaxID=2738813 RepID=UPI0015A09F9E|nr:AAA-like domain-containing protein [Pseudomonas sp. B6001]NVZ95988.1 AAA-like domain-containing protein [Pseudomonas sp. B6001]
MINKKLKPNTIVSSCQYVERAADRQLRNVIDNMGRPPYILVARQMGKTNLLINMKRERKADLVLYLDLSNRFETAKLWFRNVIDMLIECDPDVFDQHLLRVKEQRVKLELEPNVEYDRHLRLLLRSTNKKLVIVLDEIDSLVGCSYSDVVLAQIRSMYFNRVNFSEYSRLTYVLSGVAEPTDLIKNKDISPFNIGEKIYLEDFNRMEFEEFLSKVGLNFSPEVVSRIYYWVDGNPRMTWDLCSELEDVALQGREVGTGTVDDLVAALYLHEYDRAPIDHIRTLVESDSQIRSAIISIRYNRSEFPEDKIKSRLFLSGITKTVNGEIRIKNRVIDEALSDRWIDHVTSAQQSSVVTATEAYAQRNYELAIRCFEDALTGDGDSSAFTGMHRLELALSYLYVGRKSDAKIELEGCIAESEELVFLQLVRFYLGVVNLEMRDYKGAYTALFAASQGPTWTTSINAKVNLLLLYTLLGIQIFKNEALELSSELIAELQITERTEAVLDYLVSAYYNSSKIHQALGDIASAIAMIDQAVKVSPNKYLPYLLVSKSQLSKDKNIKSDAVGSIINVLIANDIDLAHVSEMGLGLSKRVLGLTLCELDALEDLHAFDRLIKFILLKYYRGKLSVFDALVDLYDSIEVGDTEEGAGISLLVRCAKSYLNENASSLNKIKVYRALALSSVMLDHNLYKSQYLTELYAGCPTDLIQDSDIEALILVMHHFLSKDFSEEFVFSISVWRKYEAVIERKDPEWAALINFYGMTYFNNIMDRATAIEYAIKLNSLIDARVFSESPFTGLWPGIRKEAAKLISSLIVDPFRHLGRNQKVYVRYADDVVLEKKYKQVSADLKEGRCVLVKAL